MGKYRTSHMAHGICICTIHAESNGFLVQIYVGGRFGYIKTFFLLKAMPFSYFIAGPKAPGGRLKMSLAPLLEPVAEGASRYP
jgi:hypothetical protein